jgi:hypothetical protein
MNGRLGCQVALLAALSLSASPARAIVFGQFDDFQDGSLEMWAGGVLHTNQPTGGPSGDPGDRYLELSTDGFVSQFGTRNEAQWTGDYAVAAVTRIHIHLNNFGPQPVSLRLMILSGTAPLQACGVTCTAWTSTNATVLPAASGWVEVEFSLDEVDLTRVAGALSYASSIGSVSRLHLRHDAGPPSPPGTPEFVNTVLGMDNAVALPEPSPMAGVLSVLPILALWFPRGGSRKHGKPFPSKWYGHSSSGPERTAF